MAGFLQGGGVGKTLAEWMIHGEAEADSWPMDIARYGDFTSNRIYPPDHRSVLFPPFRHDLPQEQLPAGRPLRRRPPMTP
ncbi:MAG: hypothetical protein CM1200mP20_05760 [Pseudomonadota bacterium]|nr:MAG: hypothetical protein CM1200mP20_05760 [Pseudomonadota bacterium]